LGNDIVDLADLRHQGKATDQRFLHRVFTVDERETVRSSSQPDQTLWMLWAGKEAAFKTLSKSLGTPPVFNHRSFRVTLFENTPEVPESSRSVPSESHLPTSECRLGEVLLEDMSFPLRIETAGSSLHALTWVSRPHGGTPEPVWGLAELGDEEEGWRARYEPHFSAQEWQCVSHRASALARLAARSALASSLDVPEEELEIGCDPGAPGRRIPRTLLRGKELEVDLTLSHHGRLLAWAFVLR
jgi:phosphopantetheinyl transferase (holo-ACP synthase)